MKRGTQNDVEKKRGKGESFWQESILNMTHNCDSTDTLIKLTFPNILQKHWPAIEHVQTEAVTQLACAMACLHNPIPTHTDNSIQCRSVRKTQQIRIHQNHIHAGKLATSAQSLRTAPQTLNQSCKFKMCS